MKRITLAVIFGIFISLTAGLVENPPEVSIAGATYYGYPFIWRTTLNGSQSYVLGNLIVNMFFWVALALIYVFLKLETLKVEKILLMLLLFIPAGFVMDLAHEFGHVYWGIYGGGRLDFIQITFFEIYPRFAFTPKFDLGQTLMSELTTDYAQGLFLLGGSLTTNIIAWLATMILTLRVGKRKSMILKTLSLIGLLDLPLYVILPQIGLHHWIFIGGLTPEPLIGAQKIGIPDPAFYSMVAFTTIGLGYLLLKLRPSRNKRL